MNFTLSVSSKGLIICEINEVIIRKYLFRIDSFVSTLSKRVDTLVWRVELHVDEYLKGRKPKMVLGGRPIKNRTTLRVYKW